VALDQKSIVESYVPINMPTHEAVHLDVPYLESFVDGQGVAFDHYVAYPCPVGREDVYDVRKAHADHSGCSNGNVYEKVGTMTCSFTGNSKSVQQLDPGLVTGSTVQLTLPLFYDSDVRKKVTVAIFDRLYLKENVASVIGMELFEHNTGGRDRLKYPVIEVESLMDATGAKYYQDKDFDIVEGQLFWRGTNQPGMNPETRKGAVCSIRYKYVPFWYVDRILHEIRLVRQGPATVRAPSSVLLQREYFFENEQNSRQAKDSPRQAVAPRDGAFGPR
jgi:hypothetical protein